MHLVTAAYPYGSTLSFRNPSHRSFGTRIQEGSRDNVHQQAKDEVFGGAVDGDGVADAADVDGVGGELPGVLGLLGTTSSSDRSASLSNK